MNHDNTRRPLIGEQKIGLFLLVSPFKSKNPTIFWRKPDFWSLSPKIWQIIALSTNSEQKSAIFLLIRPNYIRFISTDEWISLSGTGTNCVQMLYSFALISSGYMVFVGYLIFAVYKWEKFYLVENQKYVDAVEV